MDGKGLNATTAELLIMFFVGCLVSFVKDAENVLPYHGLAMGRFAIKNLTTDGTLLFFIGQRRTLAAIKNILQIQQD